MVAEVSLASTEVKVLASSNSTHENMKQKKAAKPIAATMTRTTSTAAYELGLLTAADTLTIIPGAFAIYFVRNYIAKGFALGRV